MLTKGKYTRLSVDLEKTEYQDLHQFTSSSTPAWQKSEFIRQAIREKLARERSRRVK
jgi:metal-responsive CopG/Arc/MetJ family transcriptional regulator